MIKIKDDVTGDQVASQIWEFKTGLSKNSVENIRLLLTIRLFENIRDRFVITSVSSLDQWAKLSADIYGKFLARKRNE